MRTIKATLATVLLAAAGAQPAAALEEHRFHNAQTQGGKTITQHAFWQVQPTDIDEGTATVNLECYANGAPLAAAVGFDECYLEGEDGTVLDVGDPGATPGFATARTSINIGTIDQRYRACLQTSAFFQADQTHMTTVLACSSYR